MSRFLSLWTLCVLLGSVTHQVAALWVVIDFKPMVATRLDPIVSPGQVSSHVHTIVGGNGFDKTYTYEKSLAASCATNPIQQDKSNYWAMQLYHKVDGGFKLAPLSYQNVYYRADETKEDVVPFPPGMKMLAGNAKATSFAGTLESKAVEYVCLGTNDPKVNKFPDHKCPDGLRAQVSFPFCWDGEHDWLPGSKHVSYPMGNQFDGGDCPSTHPKRIPRLFHEYIFKDDEYSNGNRVWANGDDTGYSFHADFTMGWEQGVLETFINHPECNKGFGVENCPPLAPLKNDAAKEACVYRGETVDEDIGDRSVIPALPGNNPVWSTGAKPANDYVESGQAGVNAPKIPSNWAQIDNCVSEPANGRALTGASVTDETNMSPEFCIAFCVSKGFKLAGIEWSRECFCGNEYSNGATDAASNGAVCGNECTGIRGGVGYCGGSRALSVYKYTGSGTPSVGTTGTSSAAPVASKTSTAVTATGTATPLTPGNSLIDVGEDEELVCTRRKKKRSHMERRRRSTSF